VTATPSTPFSPFAACGLLAPLSVALAMAVFTIAGWVRGDDPLWRPQELTLSEAAMVRDAAEMTRLIRGGADPNRASWVRDELVDSGRGESMTPLEAAIRNDRGEIVALLFREGLRLDADTRGAMIARARATGADEVLGELERAAVTP
jgi:hypothetical protein